MPLYDYECPECGRILEDAIQSIKDDRPATCIGIATHGPDEWEKILAEVKDENYQSLVSTENPCQPFHKPLNMIKLMGNGISFRKLGKDWPDQDSKVLKERFVKRNKRIEAMTSEQQEGFKRIIDSTGGKRYIP